MGDLREAASGILRNALQYRVPRVANIVSLNFNILRHAANSTRTLVQQHLGMRKAETLALRSGGQQKLSCAVCHA